MPSTVDRKKNIDLDKLENSQIDEIAGVSVTLPVSGTYSGDELEVYLNGAKLYNIEDYIYVGSGARTQVQFTFDLVVGDKVLFRKARDV